MHTDQVDIDPADVQLAVRSRFPALRGARVRRVRSGGTVVALFRVGDLVARFPLSASAEDGRRVQLVAEQAHARTVAAHVSVAVPEPVAVCEPIDGYRGWWSVWTWLPGETVQPDRVADLDGFARDLAVLVQEMHGIPTGGRTWDGTCRGGGHLLEKDDWVRHSTARSTHLVDPAEVTRAWEDALGAAAFNGPVSTIHSDLMPGNLLLREGRLCAAIDLGTWHVGDPASDLAPAWHILDGRTRRTWRDEVRADDDAWARGRGWALEQAIGALHYYEHTNRHMFGAARRTLGELLGER